jgi:flagellar biosynthesis GTPase FlhF
VFAWIIGSDHGAALLGRWPCKCIWVPRGLWPGQPAIVIDRRGWRGVREMTGAAAVREKKCQYFSSAAKSSQNVLFKARRPRRGGRAARGCRGSRKSNSRPSDARGRGRRAIVRPAKRADEKKREKKERKKRDKDERERERERKGKKKAKKMDGKKKAKERDGESEARPRSPCRPYQTHLSEG